MYATLTGPFAGAVLVIVGGVPITILNDCVPTGAKPFVAVTVPVYVPTTVGVPDNTPADVNVRPVGKAPAVTA